MKRLTLCITVLLAACSRSTDNPSSAAAEKGAPAVAAVDHAALFGATAADPGITWRDNGLGVKIVAPGEGRKPGIGDTVRLRYTGRLKDGTVFDRTDQPVDFQIGRTISGLSTGLQSLAAGGKGTIFIPPQLGYGSRKVAGIPADSPLIFEVEVVAINP